MKFIVGKKIEMTQIWQDDEVVAVTKVQAGPCIVTQVKNTEKDKYNAVQFGYGTRKKKNVKKPQQGHLKETGLFQCLKEFRIDDQDAKDFQSKFKKGDKIDCSSFEKGDKIQISGVSKGRGFQGVVKRHGFAGQIKTHGNKDQHRMPGSIGATGPAHVFKGMRMPGRMGGDKVSTKNLEIIKVDLENNFLYIKGSVPGARNSIVLILGNGDLKIVDSVLKKEKKINIEKNKEEKVENIKKEKNDKKIAKDESFVANEKKKITKKINNKLEKLKN